ncbi:MAG: sigma-70 family RNA polymerase sigma factor [Deltaproteobacteria bacterium]|nr:sigma-70 family RNA polymerase sigma factor [Deltaproteobacteria bacterium]
MTAMASTQRLPSSEITLSKEQGRADVDAHLVQRCKMGDVTAFDLLYRRHVSRLHRVCCSLLGSESEAEDAVQVVFTRAFRSLHKFDGRSAFSTWLYAVAVGEVNNIRRSWRRQRRLKQAFDSHLNVVSTTQSIAQDPEQAAIAKRLMAEVEAVIGSLPKKKRTAFLLYHGAELKLSEIAEVMGTSPQTISARVKSAQRDIVKKMPPELLERLQRIQSGAMGGAR